ncbi:glycosyltransferase family 2 protein [Hyunsoonleella ulvae]|uniref:glycosyltransferase family 2 protein n=1 Tax=Hyunsoonleella ulvae TaxID=2799948 RepID=UPI00193A183B|nr:glycosyltransferase family 2 protein [Hyunsoonleella ulvae]
MREGRNIVRDEKLELRPCSHRVIIPLYIPKEEGYYKDAFEIFKMCLISVQKTAISSLKISVISNGTSEEVNKKLFKLYEKGYIHELIIEKETIGKLNSILKALRTVEERLVTITDADVLFLNNWEEEIIKVFKAFPNAGMVSPAPMFRTQLRLTSNIWLRYFFSKKLAFRPVKSPEALTKFVQSIGWTLLHERYKDVTCTLKAKNGLLAVVGSAHFVGTYKRESLSKIPKASSAYKLGGDSEFLYLDLPVLKAGGYRLATYDNFAYHLGNKQEAWIQEEFDKLYEQDKLFNDFSSFKRLKSSIILYYISEKIFKKLFMSKKLKKLIFRYKGLSKKQANDFVDY